MHDLYRYIECGLDDVYLKNGFERFESVRGTRVAIRDIDSLHQEIGVHLCRQRSELSGKEIRFLRREMLMSQALFAGLINVSEQTVHRWETEKSKMSGAAEALLRLLYAEHAHRPKGRIRRRLEQIANLEDQPDHAREMVFKLTADRKTRWQLAA